MKRYGTLFSLLEDLVTRKMTVNSANVDQISLIIDLMHEYNEEKLHDIKELESKFFHNNILTKANDVFLDTEKNQRKGIKCFLPKKFKDFISKKQTNVLLNAMQLYNNKNAIIRLFENRNIIPSVHAYNTKSEPKNMMSKRMKTGI